MLYEFFNCNGTLELSKIKETFDSVSISIKLDKQINEYIRKLFDELKTISSRDSFELFLEICGNLETICDTSIGSFKKLKQHIDENSDENEFEIELKIKKHYDESTLSVYFFDEFSNYLNNEKLLDIFKTISRYGNSNIKFEVYSTITPFYSSGMVFYQANQEIPSLTVITKKSRSSKIEMYNESCNNQDLCPGFLPDDFHLIIESDREDINLFFKKACGTLSLIFLSNLSGFNEDRIWYKISGYKTVSCTGISFPNLTTNSKLLYKIYSWSYEGGNRSDKIGLLRNVLSIHLDKNDCVRFDNDVWEAIRSNYQIYLKGNIQSYLEVKNKISEMITESTSKTYSMADEFLDSLKNNVFIILTFILTVVLVNGLKDNGYQKIFSREYLCVVFILSLISLLWLRMVNNETMNRFTNATKTIKEILKLNYNKFIIDSEIDDTVDPIIEKNRLYLKGQIKRYSRWWYAILIAFVFSFSVAYYVGIHLSKDKSHNEQQLDIGKSSAGINTKVIIKTDNN